MDNIIHKACKAAFEGNIEELKFLISLNININGISNNWTLLHSAIENENEECVKLIVENGADPELKGSCSMTPLEHAIDISVQSNINTGGTTNNESTKIIKLILDAGADPRTGLNIANLYNSKKIIDLLNSYIKQ